MNFVRPSVPKKHSTLLESVRAAARQEQFLEVVSAEDARARFEKHLPVGPLGSEIVALAGALGRVVARDVIAPTDAPPFDRSSVDGFALRASDTVGATDTTPRRLRLNEEVLVCGATPRFALVPGTATTIATGGVVPRGADAVVMIEWTDLVENSEAPAIDLYRAVAAGQFVAFAGSDIARGETLLRRGSLIGSREVGVLAACGLARVDVIRRPKVAVLSTGDELVPLGEALHPGGVYDSNGAIIAAAIMEVGGEPVAFGAFPDDEAALEAAVRRALATCDAVVVSGGTSKGAGDLSHRVVSRLGEPGIVVHGVALKPGKPLCLAVAQGKPIAVLPGFPTSAIFTFHTFVAPVIRALAGLPVEAARTVEAVVAVRLPSEIGRKEFALVSLSETEAELMAFPTPKGSGAVTAFSQADGFVEIDALMPALNARTVTKVTLIGKTARAPDLVIAGSHCIALDILLDALNDSGVSARVMPIGSLGGALAVQRGECDIAPVHLLDPTTGFYNVHLINEAITFVPGWGRVQGIVHRMGDARFIGRPAEEAVAAALRDTDAIMVNRNAGSGTRILVDQLLDGARPSGYSNQPKSHNAVAAAIAQGRADWGVAIETVSGLYGLGFISLASENYDFLVASSSLKRAPVQTFLNYLQLTQVRHKIRACGMRFMPKDADEQA